MDEIYVLARRVALDALQALSSHRDSMTLVGAQAIYLQVGELADLAVPPFTSDGDFVLNPELLAASPPLEDELRAAGFTAKAGDAVGVWFVRRKTASGIMAEIPIDLLVPEAYATSRGRRSVSLEGHDQKAARRVRGLEGALIDFDRMPLGALEAGDARRFEINVAGPAALLIAKLLKIDERAGTPRESAKDALDVLRLLRGTSTASVADRWRRIAGEVRGRGVAEDGKKRLSSLFGKRNAEGTKLAAMAVGLLADTDVVRDSCVALAEELLDALA